MCDCDGWTEQSRYLVLKRAQPSSTEWEARRKATPQADNWRKLLQPEERLPPVAENRCTRRWDGDVLFAVEEVLTQTPNATPYETKRPAAPFEQVHAMLQWAVTRGLTVELVNGMTCHPGNDFNEHFTTVPLVLSPEQLARLAQMDEVPLRAELERLLVDRPMIRPGALAA